MIVACVQNHKPLFCVICKAMTFVLRTHDWNKAWCVLISLRKLRFWIESLTLTNFLVNPRESQILQRKFLSGYDGLIPLRLFDLIPHSRTLFCYTLRKHISPFYRKQCNQCSAAAGSATVQQLFWTFHIAREPSTTGWFSIFCYRRTRR